VQLIDDQGVRLEDVLESRCDFARREGIGAVQQPTPSMAAALRDLAPPASLSDKPVRRL